jgi:hypothetical protein
MTKVEATRREAVFNSKTRRQILFAQRMRDAGSGHISWLPCGVDPLYQDGRGRCGHCWECVLLEGDVPDKPKRVFATKRKEAQP